MKRRVIFPDPDIWTQRKEQLTMSASDHRRAAALIAHHRRSNLTGLNAVIDEANETGRGPELVLAVMGTYRGFIGQLRTTAAVLLASNYAQQIATNNTAEEQDPHLVQAAKLYCAHSRSDFKEIKEILSSDQPTLIFAKLLDLYEVLLPELTTRQGADWLSRQAVTMAAFEDDDEGAGE